MELSDNFKAWWRKFDDLERLKLLKEKLKSMDSAYKRMHKANEKEVEYGLNRTGLRGGKLTSLNSATERATKEYLDLYDQFKYMASTF